MNLKTKIKIDNGFTLVELLLGLAITAIIGVSIYNIFWSAMKLDDKMRRVHDHYMEVLMADESLTHDLENAVTLDLSGSYPDAVNFDGSSQEFSFLTQTPNGIKRVSYYSGLGDEGGIAKRMIGRVVNPSSKMKNFSKMDSPVEFLIRQESSLADWLNGSSVNTSIQMVATGLQKGSFNCQYAPYSKDLQTMGSKAIDYKDSWSDKTLPLAVSCSFKLYDYKNPQDGLMFKRDMFLAPVASYYNEQ